MEPSAEKTTKEIDIFTEYINFLFKTGVAIVLLFENINILRTHQLLEELLKKNIKGFILYIIIPIFYTTILAIHNKTHHDYFLGIFKKKASLCIAIPIFILLVYFYNDISVIQKPLSLVIAFIMFPTYYQIIAYEAQIKVNTLKENPKYKSHITYFYIIFIVAIIIGISTSNFT